jgi:hypothetical protein
MSYQADKQVYVTKDQREALQSMTFGGESVADMLQRRYGIDRVDPDAADSESNGSAA